MVVTFCSHVFVNIFTKPFFYLQGANASQLEKEIGSDQFPANEHYFGLVNVCITHVFVVYLP